MRGPVPGTGKPKGKSNRRKRSLVSGKSEEKKRNRRVRMSQERTNARRNRP